MNQWLADRFVSLPSALTDPLVFGSIVLALCWLCYLFCLRASFGRSALWLTLLGVSVLHVALFVLARRGMDVCEVVDRVLLSAAFLSVGAAGLLTQPRATRARRERWGFGRANAIVHAILWEAAIVILVLLWLYDAWFWPMVVS